MKKLLLALLVLTIVIGSIYTVNNYNKSASNKLNKNSASSVKNTEPQAASANSSQASSVNQDNLKNVKIKASDFILKDLSGNKVSLSDFKGKKIFLNFFATWCPPCKAEMPEIEKLYGESKGSDLVILAVDLGEDTETVSNFMNKNNFTFKVLLDSDNIVSDKYQISSIPASYFIDKDGSIVSKHIGAMTIEDMKNYISKLK